MNFVTTIGANSSVHTIDNLLTQLRGGNIAVEGPLPDGDNQALAGVPAVEYQTKLFLFQAIATSSFHIIDNPDGMITPELALQIQYAMLKQRPVIIAVSPHFSPEVPYTTRQLIQDHIDQFVILDVNNATSQEIANMAQHLPEHVDYHLSAQQQTAIHYHSKTYFRELLAQQ